MKKQDAVSRAQKVVVGITLGVFVANIVQTVIALQTISVYGAIPEWYVWYGVAQLMPILIAGAYWLAVRGDTWRRLSEALMLSVSTLLISSIAVMLLFEFLWPVVWQYFNSPSTMVVLNGAGPIFEAVVVAVLIFLMRRDKKGSQHTQSFGRFVLIIAALVFVTVTILEMAIQIGMQYPDSQDLSAYVVSFVGMGGLVIVAAVLYYLERKRGAKKPLQASVFLTTIITMALYVAVNFVSLIPNAFSLQSLAAVIITLGCIGGLFAFRWLYRTLRVLE